MNTQIHHLDGNPYNNDPANLRIVTVESAMPRDPTNPFQDRGEVQRHLAGEVQMERYDPTTEAISPVNRALINRVCPANRGVTKWLPADLDRLLDAARREASDLERLSWQNTREEEQTTVGRKDGLKSIVAEVRAFAATDGSWADQSERDAMRSLSDLAMQMFRALKQLHLKAVVGTDNERFAALNEAWATIHKAEGEE